MIRCDSKAYESERSGKPFEHIYAHVDPVALQKMFGYKEPSRPGADNGNPQGTAFSTQ